MRTSTSPFRTRTLLLAGIAVVLALAGVADRARLQRMSSRLAELEGRVAQAPSEREELERSLIAVAHEVESVRADLDRRATEAAAREIGLRLEGAEARLSDIACAVEAHGSTLAALEQEVTAVPPQILEARIAEQDRAMRDVRTSLEERVATAESTADRRIQRLEQYAETLRAEKRDVERMWDDFVGPTVQLAGEESVGSGVLLRSRATGIDENGVELYETHIITAWHVVRDIVQEDLTSPVPVSIYLEDGSVRYETAALLAHDARIDVAILRLNSDVPAPFGAQLATREGVERTRIFDRVYAVGCPLGNDPIPTPGEISTLSHVVDEMNYWMINAPTYIGNSGGGIFDADTHALLGIFSKIYTHGALRPTIVPHMGLVTPLTTIYDWMDEVGWGHLIPKSSEPAAAASEKRESDS